ncbi:HAUS augmin-like complex subunit 5 [Brachyhypopomus gauderio]|uniref:HAUS augmin-like complex subunit 5 n=1 Tax=Brachyhypopomus gauderio TaxID=698409 RepID=UPI0040414A48
MGSLPREVKRWAAVELELPTESLPHDSYIKTLCVGPGASIWKYVLQHVYHERKVRAMRGNLRWYKILQDKELKQVEGENKDALRLELQREVEDLQAELNQLDQKISTAEEHLAHQEQSVACHWDQYEKSRLRELMLSSFRQRCTQERDSLTQDTRQIHTQCQDLEQLSKKAEVKLVFGMSDGADADVAAEPLVLRNIRELCNERVLFFQSLQENVLKTTPSAVFTLDQRNAAYQHWISSVEDLLHSHPPNQVLLALQALASKQQVALEKKTASLNVEDDLSALGFRYDSNHLLDVSVEEEEDLPPVSSLIQSAWEEVEVCFLRLEAVRSRGRQLQAEVSTLMKQAQLRVPTQDDPSDPSARGVLEQEGRVVRLAAVRDSVKEQCGQLQQRNREKHQAVQNLRTHWQSVTDFRRLVDIRQEQIRSLIKGNSSIKTELARVHSELKHFVQEKLSPQFVGVVRAANGLRNSISQESKLFSLVNLSALDLRLVAGERVPVRHLSLYHGNSLAVCAIPRSLSTPTYLAPAEFCAHVASQKLELRILRRRLHLCSESLEAVQTRTAQLPAPDQKALLERAEAEEVEVLRSLLPRVHQLTQKCSKALAYGSQVNMAIAHWWEQPAQFAVPELQCEGLTFLQWLQRWKLATRGL